MQCELIVVGRAVLVGGTLWARRSLPGEWRILHWWLLRNVSSEQIKIESLQQDIYTKKLEVER